MRLENRENIMRPDKEATVAKALLKAKDLLGLKGTEIEEITGISTSKLSRIKNNGGLINDRKEYQLAVLLLRMYRSLDSITNSDRTSAEWVRNRNLALNGIPVDLMKTPQGLVDVITYLDSRRAII